MKCLQCGECCKNKEYVKLSKEEYEFLQGLEPFNLPKEKDGKYLMPKPCLFYKHGCTIYNDRPTECRMFHCGRVKEDDKPIEFIAEQRKLMDSNPEYKEFITKMQDEAAEYGNNHGWHWRK